MSYNRPLTLTVSTLAHLKGPLAVLSLLILFAAAFSPWPTLSILTSTLVLVAGWAAYILEFSKVKPEELTLVIFPDGQMRLKSGTEVEIGGFLIGQQWCTHRLAVLHVRVEDETRNFLILSAQQQRPGDFRRLNVWLRQGLCNRGSPDRVTT